MLLVADPDRGQIATVIFFNVVFLGFCKADGVYCVSKMCFSG